MTFEELDYRENDALQVWLLWNRVDDGLIVRVVDVKTEESFDLVVQAREAMDAFRHPFAYAARHDRGAARDDPGFFSRNAVGP